MTQEAFLHLALYGKVAVAFLFGGLSFLSPCVLPLVPSYISFVTGISFEELTEEKGTNELKKIIIFNSLMFILGFSIFFVVILGASAQLFGSLFSEYHHIIRKVGGAVIVLLGIHIIGIININLLQRDKRLHFFRDKPILGGIYIVASSSDTPWTGPILFISYSLGLAIPFILTSLGINTFLKHFQRFKRHMRVVSVVTGLLLIVTGVLIFFNSFAIITGYLTPILPNIG
jgi:cytochrome c-type biogenesis protein